jgi:PKD repeat protein
VTLTVTDDGGLTASVTKTVTVTAANQAPTADFTFSATNLDVSFIDASTDPDGAVVSWSWDFGDGGSSTAQNPSYTYAAAGSYDVTLTAMDNGGLTASVTKTVTVTTPNQAPTADFTFSVTDLDVSFSDASTDPDGAVVSWSWDFGDGGSSTAQNPSHTYAAAGSYDVTLTVTDDGGLTASVTKAVTVTAPPQIIRVKAASSSSSTISVGGLRTIPVIVDMSDAGGLNIASFDIRLTWNSGIATYVSSSAGSFGSVTINDGNASNGVVRAVGFSASGTTNSFTAFSVTLEGAATGSTTVSVEVLAVGDELGANLLGNVSTRNHTLTVN